MMYSAEFEKLNIPCFGLIEEKAEICEDDFLWAAWTSINFFKAGYCRILNGEEEGVVFEFVSDGNDDNCIFCWCGGNIDGGTDEDKGGKVVA